jgi:hypothetical protein
MSPPTPTTTASIGHSLAAWIPVGATGGAGPYAGLDLFLRRASGGHDRAADRHLRRALAHYHRPPLPADLPYEYRKELLGYAIIAGLFWLFQVPGLRAPRPGAKNADADLP